MICAMRTGWRSTRLITRRDDNEKPETKLETRNDNQFLARHVDNLPVPTTGYCTLNRYIWRRIRNQRLDEFF